MSNEDFSAFGTLLSEKPEALDFSAFGDPVDAPANVTPPVRTVLPPTPDEPGIMDEVRGLGRALQRGGYRARQAVNTMALTDALEMQRRVSDLEKQYADWEAQNSGKVDPTGRTDIIRDRFKRGIAMAKAQAGTSAGLSGTASEAGQAITRDQAKIDLLPPTEGLNKWQTAEDYLGAFLDNPVEVSTSIMAESLPLSVPGMIAGTAAAGPVGTALGAGAGSFAAEYSTSILDSLVKAGIDITKPDWEKTVTDEQLKLATEYAVKRGVPISILDGISGGLAGKFLGKAIGQGVGKIATGAIKESAMQAGTGMAGEALAQVNTGQPLDFRDILAEGIAEGPSAIYETAKNVIESKATQQQPTESKPDFSQYGKAVTETEDEATGGAPGGEPDVRPAGGVGGGSDENGESGRTATVADVRSLLEEYLQGKARGGEGAPVASDVQSGLYEVRDGRPDGNDVPDTAPAEPLELNQNLAEELKQSLLKNQIPPIPKPSEPTKLPESVVNRAPVRDQAATVEPAPVAIPPDQQAQPQQPEAERLSVPEERPPQERELSNYERLTGKQEDFSRQGTPVIPSKASDLQPQVDAIASKLPGAVPHEIVQSTKDLPQQIQRPDAEAAYYDGKVWIVADNIPDAETAVKKYFHEQVGHHGLRVVLGQQFEPVMRSVVSRYIGTQPMAAITEAYGLDLSKDADRLVAAEEIVARLAENPELNPTLWRRIVTEIKKAWRKLTGSAISEDEIKDMIRRAYRRLEQDPSKAEAQPRFSVLEVGKDKDYLEAVNRGDLETAQKMVDEAAKAKFKSSVVIEPLTSSREKASDKPMLKVYHGTGSEFNQFNKIGKGVSDYGWLGIVEGERHGIFFAENKEFAKTFAKSKGGNRVVSAFLDIKNPFTYDDAVSILESRNLGDEFTKDSNIAKWFHNLTDQWEAFDDDNGKVFTDWLKSKGFDGAKIKEEGVGIPDAPTQDVWVALDPSQIKSADPVTRDDSGNVIPLSKRFNKASSDIRYSVPEGGYSGKREPGEGEETRRFTRQLDASSDIDDTIKEKIQNYVYKVRSAKTDAAFAAEMVNDLGVDKAIDLFKNPTAEIPGAIRTRIGNSIIKELGRQERAARAGGRYKEADALVSKATQFIDDEFLNRSTDLGQSVQAFNDFSYLTPGGWLATAKRVIEKAGGKARKRIDPFTKKAKKVVGDINKGAVAGVVEDVAASPKAKEIVAEAASKGEAQKKEAKATAQQQLDIWSRYKNLIANSLKPVVQGMVGKSRPSPALQGFSSRVLSVLRANLEKGKEKQAPALTDIQVIAEALSNPEKYQEAWLNAGEVLREHFKDDPAALALIDASMALNPELVQNSRLDRAMAKKLKELNLKLSEIIRTHYTEENASTRLLSDKLVQEAGLSGEQALELARLVKERMATVTKERKTKALEQAIKAKDGASERKKKQLSQKIVELSNLGAFSDDMAAGEAGKLLDIPTLNEQQKAEIYRQADALQQLPEDSPQRVKATVQLMNFIAKASGRKFYDLPVAFWYANVLSGPITHVYNALSNTLSLAGNLASTLARQPTSLPAAMNAAITGFRKGGSDAAETLRSGKQVTDMKFENINQLELLDDKDLKGTAKFLKYWKYVSRSMIAADQLFFASAKEAKATILARGIAKEEGLRGDALDVRVRQILGEDTRAQAEAQATTEGLTGIEFNRRVNQLVEAERDQDVQELATNFARLTTFNNEPYGLLGAIARGLNAINRETVVSRIVVPFVNIAANVTNESLNYSPIGALRAAVAHRSLSRTGEGTLHGNDITSMDPVLDAYSKAALGTLMLGMIIAYAAKNIDDDDPDFMLNGQGPKDWRRRRSLVETGWKPYSLKVGKTYISFKDTPFAIPLGVAANYLDAVRYGKLEEQDLHNRLGYAMMQIPHVIVQQSFLDSLANLLGAVDRSSEKKAGDRAIEQVLRSSTSTVVPNLARQIDRIFDPTIYKSEDIQSAFIQQLPFVRRTGKPELNAFGEPVQSSPFKRFGSFETQDPLWQSLGRKYALPTPPGQGLLKDDEYYELIKVRGPILRQALETRLDIIKLQTPDQARATVRAEAAKATTRAKEQLGFKALEKTRRDEAKLKGLQTTE